MIQPYQAVVMQGSVREIRDKDTQREIIRDNAWRQILLLRRIKYSYPRLKLVVMSEHSIHGLDAGRPRATIAELAVSIDDELFRPYRMAAKELELYICFTFEEADSNFPGTFFHSGVLIGPDGQVILRQRMLNGSLAQSGGTGHATRLTSVYGWNALCPVADTPIGKLGVIVGGDIYQPEMARVLAMQGAELLIHPTGSRDTEASRAVQGFRQSAAYYNQAYMLCANIGSYYHKKAGDPPPETDDELIKEATSTFAWGQFEFCGRSQIVDFRGKVVAICQQAGEAACGAVIDVERVRHERRARPLLQRLSGKPLAREYAAFPGTPHDIEEGPDPRAVRAQVGARLREKGIVQPSEAYGSHIAPPRH